uniref:Uncharacterized protein n=1 Tax=Cucumis melo TaxID=3656 RepID=A0A9I9EAE7_CUCME
MKEEDEQQLRFSKKWKWVTSKQTHYCFNWVLMSREERTREREKVGKAVLLLEEKKLHFHG